MRTLEIAGPIGAGKSSLVAPLARALRERGATARPLDTVVSHGRLQRAFWSFVFGCRHPRLVARATRAMLSAPIPWWHRRIIIGLVLGVGGRTLAASRRTANDEWVIVDEGLVHRALNLFAWRPEAPAREVAGYVAAVPVRGAVVIIEARPEVELQRALQRGLPKRLVGRPPEEVRAFVARAREIVLFSADAMEKRGARIVRADGEAAADEVASFVADALLDPARPGLGTSA